MKSTEREENKEIKRVGRTKVHQRETRKSQRKRGNEKNREICRETKKEKFGEC